MIGKPTVIDCFCGAGGLSFGFKKAGFKIIYAFDSDKNAIATYSHNFKNTFVQKKDIQDINKKYIETQIGYELNDIQIVVGGPPCQGFSQQRRGRTNDERNGLILEFMRLVLEIRPRFFLIENVGGILTERGKPYLYRLVSMCGNDYYIHTPTKLNAYQYGVPQNRKRVFIVGENRENGTPRFEFPKPTRCKYDPATVEHAIFDLSLTDLGTKPNHIASGLTPINLRRIRSIKAGEGRTFLPPDLQLACHIRNPSHEHSDVYGRMAWNKPSPTITTKCHSISNGRFGHPVLDRAITLREGARLQSFPDSFVFLGGIVHIAAQIGNAVPPKLALALARKIRQCL